MKPETKINRTKRKTCPTQEVNPKAYVHPLKVLLQSIFFPLISKIKKMPPIRRMWNYETASWDFLHPPEKVMNGAPKQPMATRSTPKGSMGKNQPPDAMKQMQMKMVPGEKIQKLYNCIHCNRCHTSHARIKLKQRMFERGQVPNEFGELFRSYRAYNTPLHQNSRRIREFPAITKTSSTLLYIGCFSSIKTPTFAEHAIEYLLQQQVDFTILKEEICCGLSLETSGEKQLSGELRDRNLQIFKERGFQEIICLCPACYNTFRKNYEHSGIKIRFITEYLTPMKSKAAAKTVEIQHSCHLLYEGKKNLTRNVERVLKESGFLIRDTPHWCCGGGMGLLYITDTIEKIGWLRATDFNHEIVTTYCPSCYWMLKIFGRKEKQEYQLKDIYQLLMA